MIFFITSGPGYSLQLYKINVPQSFLTNCRVHNYLEFRSNNFNQAVKTSPISDNIFLVKSKLKFESAAWISFQFLKFKVHAFSFWQLNYAFLTTFIICAVYLFSA